jgi:hypothetical protein
VMTFGVNARAMAFLIFYGKYRILSRNWASILGK